MSVQRLWIGGRLYLVTPLTFLLADVVLPSTDGVQTLFPSRELAVNPSAWDAIALVYNHDGPRVGPDSPDMTAVIAAVEVAAGLPAQCPADAQAEADPVARPLRCGFVELPCDLDRDDLDDAGREIPQ
jgi:hypothetical protein